MMEEVEYAGVHSVAVVGGEVVKNFCINMVARRGVLHRARPQIGRSVPCGIQALSRGARVIMFPQVLPIGKYH